MLHNLLDTGSLVPVLPQHDLDQMASFPGELSLRLLGILQSLVDDRIFQLSDASPLERHHAAEHGEQADTEAPNIGLLAAELLVALEDFGSHVCRCAALVLHHICGLVQELRDAEVADFHCAFIVKQQVFQLDISVEDAIAMAVGQAFGNLLEEELGNSLVKLLPAANEAKQIAAGAELHDEAQVGCRLERVVELDYILVAGEVLEDLHVLCDLLFALHLLVQLFLAQALDGDKVAAQLMLGDAYFAEGAFSELVADAIELVSRGHRLAALLEVSDDIGH